MQNKTGFTWILCRICLKTSSSKLVSIFESEHLAQQICDHGGITLSNNKLLPDKICEKCLLLLKAALKFRQLCRRSEQQLTDFFEIDELESGSPPQPHNPKSIPGSISSNSDDEKVKASLKPTADLDLSTEYLVDEIDLVEERQREENESETIIAKQTLILLESNRSEFIELSDDGVDYLEDTSNANSVFNELTHFEEPKQNENSSQSPSNNVRYVTELMHTEGSKHSTIYDNKSIDKLTAESSINVKHNQRKVKKKINPTRNESQKRKRVNSSEPPNNHVCTYCGNVYSEKAKLTNHIKMHTKEKPHECEICHKRFTQTPQLARHMNSHTGNRPFQCKFCNASFADPSTCIKHQRIHTNERPYRCEHCNKAFSYSNVLKVHLMTHTGEKPYECKYCGKRFTQLHHKKAHESTHELRY